MKKVLIIGIPILLIAAAVVIVLPQRGSEGHTDQFDRPDLASCGDGPLFTELPITFEDLHSIIPLGNLSPSAHTFPTDHVYFNFAEGKTNIPVYLPGDAIITSVSSTEHLYADPPFTDFSVRFWPCKDIEAYFIHLSGLSEMLSDILAQSSTSDCNAYETGGNTYRNCRFTLEEEVKAGEQIGTTARPGQHNFDLGVYDYTKLPNKFANQERWEQFSPNYPYTQCPFDYFTPDIQSTLAGLFTGPYGEPRTIAPVCGTIAQDINGTAQGVWFAEGTPYVDHSGEDPHVALVHDNFDPTLAVFSVGTSVESYGVPSGKYFYTPTTSSKINADFSAITPSDSFCFETRTEFDRASGPTILLTMPDENTLHLSLLDGTQCGEGPWILNQYSVFER